MFSKALLFHSFQMVQNKHREVALLASFLFSNFFPNKGSMPT